MSTRKYESPRRAASARATRAAVIKAADELFVGRGYGATTLAAVAERAGVSLATVKLVAPTKSALLLEAFGQRVRSAVEPAGGGRRTWADLLTERDPARLIETWAALTTAAHEQTAPLFEVCWQAGPSEPELADVYQRGAAGRRANFRDVVKGLASLGALRPELSVETAVDIAWVINSPLTFRQFTACGWTSGQWQAWLTATLAMQLIGGREGPPGESRSDPRGRK